MIDKLLLELVRLSCVLALAVHQVNLFGWMDQGDHSEPLLLLALFYQSTPSCSKVMGWGVGWGGPCDFSVSPSPFNLDFGTLDFGTSDSGLTICLEVGPTLCCFLWQGKGTCITNWLILALW